MAQVFRRALGRPAAPQEQVVQPTISGSPNAYDMLMAEYQKLAQPASTQPMYTPEQQEQRIDQYNRMMELGIAGQLSPQQRISNVGAQVFKNALAGIEEKQTKYGTFDPLTGTTAESPEWRTQRGEDRRAKVLDALTKVQEARQRAVERAELDADRRQNREDMIRLAASLRGGASADTSALKEELLRTQIAEKQGKLAERQEKQEMAMSAGAAKAQDMIANIDRASKKVGMMTAGPLGRTLAETPIIGYGTKAYELQKDIDTIKANIGFEELNRMRQMSPTGGALGQVALRELDMLQSTIASLDTGLSPSALRENLGRIKQHYTNWLKTVQGQAPSQAPSQVPRGRPIAPSTQAPAPTQSRTRLRFDPATGELVSQ